MYSLFVVESHFVNLKGILCISINTNIQNILIYILFMYLSTYNLYKCQNKKFCKLENTDEVTEKRCLYECVGINKSKPDALNAEKNRLVTRRFDFKWC